MATSGNLQPLYGKIICEKAKTADLTTLKAYRTVATDLIKGHSGPEAEDLRSCLGDLDTAIKAKGG